LGQTVLSGCGVGAFTQETQCLDDSLCGYLPRPRIEIAGPQGVQASFDWQAAKATSPARMCTAVLINTLTGY
jgi:hypothetical protein